MGNLSTLPNITGAKISVNSVIAYLLDSKGCVIHPSHFRMYQLAKEVSYADVGLVDPEESPLPGMDAELNQILIEGDNPKKRKRAAGGNNKYTPEDRALGGAYAVEHGNTKAAKYMSLRLMCDVNESTIRGWKQKYLIMKSKGEGPVLAIHEEKRGASTLVPKDCEDILKARLKKYSETGKHISSKTTIRLAKAIVRRKDVLLWSRLNLGKSWTQSLFRRMRWCRRKVTRAARCTPENMEIKKKEFLKKIKKKLKKYGIPSQLCMNMDQIGCLMVATQNSTMAEKGAKQVSQIGKGDKRGMTAVITSTLRGRLLSPQLIYKGTTSRCHPKIKIPGSWNVTQNLNHWSTTETMHEYLQKILIPHCVYWRQRLNLPADQKALLILDVFRPHTEASFNEACEAANICRVFVPPGCTSSLQPLDADGGVNYVIKKRIADQYDQFNDDAMWEAERLGLAETASFKPDLRLSALKPLHAECLLKSFQSVTKEHPLIRKGWEKSGIMDVYQELLED